MCDGFLDDWPSFKIHFWALFEKLAQDKVINVRICVARVLVNHMDKKSAASKEAQVQELYMLLSKDSNADVIRVIKKEHTFIEETISKSPSLQDSNNSEEQMEVVHQGQGVLETKNLLHTLDHIVSEAKEHASPSDQKLLDETVLSVSPVLKAIEKELELAVETKMIEELTPEVEQAIKEAEVDKKIVEEHRHHQDLLTEDGKPLETQKTTLVEEEKIVPKDIVEQPESDIQKEEQQVINIDTQKNEDHILAPSGEEGKTATQEMIVPQLNHISEDVKTEVKDKEKEDGKFEI